MKYSNFEYQYRDSLQDFIDTMTLQKQENCFINDRTGTGTLFRPHQYFYLKDITNEFPLLRGKKVYPYMAYKELIWMLRGRTDVQWLRDHKVTYWDEWELPDGTIGHSYGYQYRNFNGVDQIKNLCDDMIANPLSRRLIVDLWNVSDLDKMALPPCQFLYQFTCLPIDKNGTIEYVVDLHAIQRSGDSFLGVPYNFMFSSLFLTLICDYCTKSVHKRRNVSRYVPRDVHHTVNHYHLYRNHIDQAIEYIKNVNENRDNCIDIPTKIELNLPNRLFNNIDEYLDCIEDTGIKESLNVSWNGDYQYGVIKADISV